MSDPQRVIVYRSQSEAMLDQLIWNNPEVLVWALAGVLVLILAYAGFLVFRRK